MERSGTTLRTYVDGVVEGSVTIGASDTIDAGGGVFSLGGPIAYGTTPQTNYFAGSISEFRFSTAARYSGAFTPPNYSFSNDSDTMLLLHQTSAEQDSSGVDIILDDGGTDYGNDLYIIEQNNGSPVVQQKNPPKIKLLDANQELWDGLVDVMLVGYPKIQLTETGVSSITVTGGI
jgi:hypothetical protein